MCTVTDSLKTTNTSTYQVYTSSHETSCIDSHLKSEGLYERMMPLCVPVCGLSLVLISENEIDFKNLLFTIIALTV